MTDKLQAPAKGDYVLATLYPDGNAADPWFIGYYDCLTNDNPPRHFILDNEGKRDYHSYRKVSVITQDIGDWLIKEKDKLETLNKDLWPIVNRLL
jgi:hypothetical protein